MRALDPSAEFAPLSAAAGKTGRSGDARIADIEALRAVAILFVLVEHARINLFSWIGGPETKFYNYFGFQTGVDLFFAISGFVIARSLVPSLVHARDSTEFFNRTFAFWVRRAFRLLPSAWLWLAIPLILVVFFNRSGAFGTFKTSFEGAIAAIMYVANFRTIELFFRGPLGVNFPYWSLSLEEQFYFMFPFLVFIFRRRLPWFLVITIALQFFATRDGEGSLGLGIALNQLKSDAISFGVLIALWSKHPTYALFEPVVLRLRPALRLVTFVLLILLLAVVDAPGLNIVWFGVGLAAAVSAILVLIASYNQDYLCPRGPVRPVLMWIGTRSYALYLVHVPAYILTREIWFRLEPAGTSFGGTFTLRFVLTAAVLLVTLAELNYRLIETPFRRYGAKAAGRLLARGPAAPSEEPI